MATSKLAHSHKGPTPHQSPEPEFLSLTDIQCCQSLVSRHPGEWPEGLNPLSPRVRQDQMKGSLQLEVVAESHELATNFMTLVRDAIQRKIGLLAIWCGLRFEGIQGRVWTTERLARSARQRQQGPVNPPEDPPSLPSPGGGRRIWARESRATPVSGVSAETHEHAMAQLGPNQPPGRPPCSTETHPPSRPRKGSRTVARGRLRTHPGMSGPPGRPAPEGSHRYGALAPLQSPLYWVRPKPCHDHLGRAPEPGAPPTRGWHGLVAASFITLPKG